MWNSKSAWRGKKKNTVCVGKIISKERNETRNANLNNENRNGKWIQTFIKKN